MVQAMGRLRRPRARAPRPDDGGGRGSPRVRSGCALRRRLRYRRRCMCGVAGMPRRASLATVTEHMLTHTTVPGAPRRATNAGEPAVPPPQSAPPSCSRWRSVTGRLALPVVSPGSGKRGRAVAGAGTPARAAGGGARRCRAPRRGRRRGRAAGPGPASTVAPPARHAPRRRPVAGRVHGGAVLALTGAAPSRAPVSDAPTPGEPHRGAARNAGAHRPRAARRRHRRPPGTSPCPWSARSPVASRDSSSRAGGHRVVVPHPARFSEGDRPVNTALLVAVLLLTVLTVFNLVVVLGVVRRLRAY